MVQFIELDANVTFEDQMRTEQGPVILINGFTVDPTEEDAFIKAWSGDADLMKAQPGFISTQLHKGIGGSSVYVNYAVWESVNAFRNAFMNPEFQSRIKNYPKSAVASPHLFKKLAVPGHCVA